MIFADTFSIKPERNEVNDAEHIEKTNWIYPNEMKTEIKTIKIAQSH